MNTTRYEIKGRLGIDDLYSLYAFHGNSQGDESVSNNIADFEASKGWMSFGFDCEMTDEAIAKEIQRRKDYNELYIRNLRAQGRYGEEYIQYLELEYNPLFDGKQVFPHGPLESYRMIFIDFSNNEDDKL